MNAKLMRDELGIDGSTELELTACDGALELTVRRERCVEQRDGLSTIVIAPPPPPIGARMVRACSNASGGDRARSSVAVAR